MFELYHDMIGALSQPSHRHAMLIHFPVVLSFAAMVSLIMLAISRGKSASWRCTSMILLVLGILFSKLAESAGEGAVEQLSLPLTTQAGELLEAHENAAEWLWVFFTITALLVIPTWFKSIFIRYPATILAVLSGFILVLWMSVVAHYGGSLVYDHGVGVPHSTNNVQMKSGLED